MPAPVAPPVKETPAPAEPKIVIPPLAQISPGAEPPKPGEPPPKIETQIAKPPGPGADDDSGIPTNIIDPKHKSPAQFAEERRESKVAQVKRSLEEVQREADDSKMELARVMTEKEERDRKIADAEKARDEFKAEAERLRGEVSSVNDRYFKANEAVFNPNTDEELRAASTSMFTAMNERMPSKVVTTDGSEKRVFFDQLVRSSPQIAAAMEQLVGHYAGARMNGDAKGIDRAVSAAAQILGANAFVGNTEDEDRLLNSSDPVFNEIEAALKDAIPHFTKKQQRLQTIQQDGPRLVTERLAKKEGAIRSRLEQSVFMADADVSSVLSATPTDSRALFAAILNRAPHLREIVQAKITSSARVFSRLKEGVDLPTLTKNDAVSIAEHRRQIDQTNQEIDRAMTAAIIGDSVGPILASLIAERDAAETRAQAAANNTNPGGNRPGDDRAPGGGAIDTEIVK